MSPDVALSSERAGASTRPCDPKRLLERFAAAVKSGKTIALVVAKGPETVVVYYFRDASRARETLERLARLGVSPAVAYVSVGDGSHRAAAEVDPASALRIRTIDWLARLILGRAAHRRAGKTPAPPTKTRSRSFDPQGRAKDPLSTVTKPARAECRPQEEDCSLRGPRAKP